MPSFSVHMRPELIRRLDSELTHRKSLHRRIKSRNALIVEACEVYLAQRDMGRDTPGLERAALTEARRMKALAYRLEAALSRQAAAKDSRRLGQLEPVHTPTKEPAS